MKSIPTPRSIGLTLKKLVEVWRIELQSSAVLIGFKQNRRHFTPGSTQLIVKCNIGATDRQGSQTRHELVRYISLCLYPRRYHQFKGSILFRICDCLDQPHVGGVRIAAQG